MALQNNAGIILTIVAFYVALGVIFGLIGTSEVSTSIAPEQLSATGTSNGGLLGLLSSIAIFFSAIAFVISGIPLWLNLIIFAPLSVTILYILIEVAATAVP